MSARDIARRLLREFHSLTGVFMASLEELVEVEGVGIAIASRLAAVGEIMKRIVREPLPDKEYVFIMCVDGSMGIIISGTDTQVTVNDKFMLLPCHDVAVYHYHCDESLPSISDEWLTFYLKKKGLQVVKYEIITSHMDIYDVLSKVDYVKGE
jgi:hypothetical protein